MRSLILPLIFSLYLNAVGAQESALSQQMQEMGNSFEKQFLEFRKKSAEAKRNQQPYPPVPNSADQVNQLLKLIAEDPTDPAVVDASAWIMRWGRYAKPRVDASIVYETLWSHHLDNQAIGSVCVAGMYDYHPKALQLIQKVRDNEENAASAGAAAWVLAKRATRPHQEEEKIKHLKFAAETLGDFKLGKSNTPLLNIVKKDLARAERFATGQVAPEITGKDTQGVEFKLSDYRGKVVVLDFWGHW